MSKVFPIILYYNVGENLKNKTFNIPPNISIKSFVEKFNIENDPDSFEQRRYENTIKRNFANSIREKLILKLSSFKWLLNLMS